ncbi:MAG: PP2C family protein-serine/threonine phosphatase [Selenomonadaceae bacterium]|nr:PP2C family protein-serine/threonine phosphatase [Selenomonadaceae bacterium]
MRSSISTKILFDVILALFVLSAILSYLGYWEFTQAIEKQYQDTALRSARTAITFVNPDKISDYNDTGGNFYNKTLELAQEWGRLIETQGLTFIYVIQPDISKDYNEIRFALSMMNTKANYEKFHSGHLRKTSNEEYRQAYIDLYQGKKESATIIRDNGVSTTGDHITVMIPVKNDSDEIKGILCVQRQMEDLRTFRMQYLQQMFLATVAVFLIVLLIYAVYLKKTVLNPIKKLSDGVRDIASGNLDKKIDINTKDEIEHLAICFNMMTDELKTYMNNLTKVTAEKERFATELNVAKDIQLSILPHDFNFNRKDFEIFATMNAAKEVGGDFYDFYLLDEDHLVMTVADVSGKGIPASLFMMTSKTILKNFATFATNPDDFAAVVSCANNQLCQNNDEMMFVTVFFGVLEISTGKFIFVNGGHNPPVIYHKKENRCEFLKVKKNFVLGGMDNVPFKQQEIYFESGDLIFAYTDGVNEAMNINHEEYTSEKLLSCMNSIDLKTDLQTILKNIRADVAEHVGRAEQSDDMTMMALRFNGKD